MQIAILGITGSVGSEFAKLALENGHVLAGVTRDPGKVGLSHQNLTIHKGEAANEASILNAIKGCQVVVSTVGTGNLLQARKPTTLYSTTAKVLLSTMQKSGIERLVAVTAGGMVPNPTWPWFYRLIIHPLLREMYLDMRRMEDVIEASSIRHLFIRPVRLISGQRTGVYRVEKEVTPNGGFIIRHSDVADYMLKRIEADDYQAGGIGISY